MEAFDDSIRHEFINEAREKIEEIESAFLNFRREPKNSAIIDQIFRLAHTIKGSAMTVGFMKLGEFAHVVETLLVKIKENSIAADDSIIDVLLLSNDRLHDYIEALDRNFDAEIETEDIVDSIQAILAQVEPGKHFAPVHPVVKGPAFGFFDDEPTMAPAAAAAAAAAPTPAPVQVTTEDKFPELERYQPTMNSVAAETFRAYVNLINLSLDEERGGDHRSYASTILQLQATLREISHLQRGNHSSSK